MDIWQQMHCLVLLFVMGELKILSYMHDLGLAHRDFKPDNMLLMRVSSESGVYVYTTVDGRFHWLVLADFGNSLF